MEVKVYQNKVKVAEEFSKYLIEKSDTQKAFHIALSGGSTPKIVFDVLAEQFSTDVDWKNIHLYWGDERCVTPTDDESNYKMTVEHLISKVAIPEENIHRIKGENDSKEEAKRYGDLLDKELPKALEYRNKNINEVLSTYSEEELNKIIKELIIKSNPLWSYNYKGHVISRQHHEAFIIGVPNVNSSIINKDTLSNILESNQRADFNCQR